MSDHPSNFDQNLGLQTRGKRRRSSSVTIEKQDYLMEKWGFALAIARTLSSLTGLLLGIASLIIAIVALVQTFKQTESMAAIYLLNRKAGNQQQNPPQ